MTGIMSDFRDAARMLLRSPGFTAVAVLMLALGIGVNTTVFSWLNAVLLSPLPGAHDPHRIVQLGTTFKGNIDTSFSYVDYQQLRSLDGFAGMAAAPSARSRCRCPWAFAVTGPDDDHAGTGVVRAGVGQLLLVAWRATVAGRAFLPNEVRGAGDAPVTVISDAIWARHFNRDPSAVGRAVLVTGTPVTVIGIAPPVFQGSVPALSIDLWLPVTQPALVAPDLQNERLTTPGWHWLDVLARPAQGVTIDEARARFAAGRTPRSPASAAGVPTCWARCSCFAIPRAAASAAATRAARAGSGRRPGPAHRLREPGKPAARARVESQARVGCSIALGASRSDLMRLLFAESVLLAAVGAAAALLVTGWASGLLMGFAPPADARVSIRVPIDGTVLAFALLAGVVTAVLLGMLPAWTATSGNMVDALKDGTPGAGSSRPRIRAALVVVQVALSVVLLAAAGLCVRSLIDARSIRPGFNTSGVLLAKPRSLSSRHQQRGRAPPLSVAAPRRRPRSWRERRYDGLERSARAGQRVVDDAYGRRLSAGR